MTRTQEDHQLSQFLIFAGDENDAKVIGQWIACPDKKGARCFVVPESQQPFEQGEPGATGPVGPMGPEGPQGATGPQGIKGNKGMFM